ncbi:hypothetical protein ABZ079_28640 [Streptomyces sp. NPDC006314]|uniref:hypothetical protein n=1 Tax=Streptomyces sp. NPDC006314 TaxID=3154475 RepID=UPI0033B76708
MSLIRKRVGTILGMGAMLVGVALTAGAGTANAMDPDGSYTITIHNSSGKVIGYARWNADPQPAPDIPGDALIAKDVYADGLGIEAELSNGRIASTRGHDSPYMKIVPGNLPEGKAYKLRGCIVTSTYRECSPWHDVRA